MFGFDFKEASFLYVLLYAKCAGGMITLIDDQFPGNAQEYKVKVKLLYILLSLLLFIRLK